MIAQLTASATILGCCGLILALLIVALDKFLSSRMASDDLVVAVNNLLPQTQCAQCGYPGCEPYARAVIDGENLGLCVPGGEDTRQNLAEMLNRSLDDKPLSVPTESVARIREDDCIGCGLCAKACPVDAIAGAPTYLYTVLEKHCTGCELCLPPCPVDCIDLHAPS